MGNETWEMKLGKRNLRIGKRNTGSGKQNTGNCHHNLKLHDTVRRSPCNPMRMRQIKQLISAGSKFAVNTSSSSTIPGLLRYGFEIFFSSVSSRWSGD